MTTDNRFKVGDRVKKTRNRKSKYSQDEIIQMFKTVHGDK